jgi:hypothetical protein
MLYVTVVTVHAILHVVLHTNEKCYTCKKLHKITCIFLPGLGYFFSVKKSAYVQKKSCLG